MGLLLDRIRFQEELALKNSLHSIGPFVLEHAVKLSGASSGVFLYAAPGAAHFEKVATIGLSKDEDASWSRCNRGSGFPLPEAIRSQKLIEIADGNKITLMAFPLNDSDITTAGFSISFLPGRPLDTETKDFLFSLVRLAESALFNKDGEGI